MILKPKLSTSSIFLSLVNYTPSSLLYIMSRKGEMGDQSIKAGTEEGKYRIVEMITPEYIP